VNDAFGIVEGFVVDYQNANAPALSNRLISSPSGMSRFTATMSARWIHHVGDALFIAGQGCLRNHGCARWPKKNQLRPACFASSHGLAGRSRTDPGFPSEQRADRADQPVVGGRDAALRPPAPRPGRLRVLRGIVVGWLRIPPSQSIRSPIRIGIGNAELRQESPAREVSIASASSSFS